MQAKAYRITAENIREGDTIVDRSNSRFDMFVEEVSTAWDGAIKCRNEGATTFYRPTDIVWVRS